MQCRRLTGIVVYALPKKEWGPSTMGQAQTCMTDDDIEEKGKIKNKKVPREYYPGLVVAGTG